MSTLFSVEDAIKLNNMEPPTIEVCTAVLYDGKELDVEVYMPKAAITQDDPEGCCSGWSSRSLARASLCVCVGLCVCAEAMQMQERRGAE